MLDRIFDGSLMPHGHCLLWRWDLLFLHLGGDLLTVMAYSLIPFGIFYFLQLFRYFAGSRTLYPSKAWSSR